VLRARMFKLGEESAVFHISHVVGFGARSKTRSPSAEDTKDRGSVIFLMVDTETGT
jgi:hypothetical protein